MWDKLKFLCQLSLIFCLIACKGKTKSLPRSLSKEEISGYLPGSVPTPITETERKMINQGLVDVQSLDAQIMVDLKYAGTDNFLKENVYGTLQPAYLQKEPAQALTNANRLLMEKNGNYRLLIYDAARPLSVQKILWEKLDSISERERKKYVADPEIGSIHNYGCAVDLTIFDKSSGYPLDMGTSFDFFGEEAYPRLERKMLNEGKLSLQQLNNRQLLRQVMEVSGFLPITSEWWHFNYYSRPIAKEKYRIIE